MEQDRERKVFFKRKPREPDPAGLAVALRDGESTESLLRRFKRMVDNSGILREVRERESYVGPSQAKIVKRRKAAKRRAKAASRSNDTDA